MNVIKKIRVQYKVARMFSMDLLESTSPYESIGRLKNSQMRLSFIGLFTEKLNVKKESETFSFAFCCQLSRHPLQPPEKAAH